MTDFDKFAVKGRGISSMTLSRYTSIYDGYINPTITEERKLNVAQMDVFSRLMRRCGQHHPGATAVPGVQ